MKKTQKSTTRQKNTGASSSQKQRIGSVQHTFCPLQYIKQEALCLQGATGREWLAILEVQGINYRLRDEDEQYQLNEQFQQILVALTHPLQILLRIVPMDVERYLAFFTPKDSPDSDCRWPLIWRELASSHIQFMRALVTRRSLLEHR